jgi:hypothetical protein
VRKDLMAILSIKNNSPQQLRIILEPWADSYDLEPGEQAEINGEFTKSNGSSLVEVYPDNCLSIWVSEKTTVYKNGILAKSTENT